MQPDAKAQQGVAALERALMILDAFREQSGHRSERTLSEIADHTGLYKSTILRLCSSLQRYGYLARLGSGTFVLGPSVFELGQVYRRSHSFAEDLRPILRDLVAATRESASFWILHDQHRICLIRVDSPQPVRDTSIREGDRLPLDEGATSRVLRTFSNRERPAGAPLNEPPETSFGGYLPDLAGMSRPIFASGQEFMGAITLAGPSSRFAPAVLHRFEEALRDASRRAIGALGGEIGSNER